MNLKDKLTGKFIVLDGPDGAGKSTQLGLLESRLTQAGLDVLRLRDPGGTTIGDKIRHILLDNDHHEMSVQCELMLYMASRAQLAHQVIRPALAGGKCVLCDRYISSTIAYQGAGGVEVADICTAGRIAVGQTWPDLTIILDLPAETGMQRLKGKPDRMEAKPIDFHRKVRELFLSQGCQDPRHYAVVDAGADVQKVHERVLAAVEKWAGSAE